MILDAVEKGLITPGKTVLVDITGAELWEATAGKVDIFVAGCGTGGTVTGAGQYGKSKKPSIQVGTVQPAESAVLSGWFLLIVLIHPL
ncbi:unnamed protein product [Sphagnum troendelagicum]|uniref:Tryptophan synthase beta chain-like PALP domain-containing protein n=1 Tax=Sphagnum troendelagicum TaxID=128251 RepID=A0ABP0UC51_9BRYO